MKFSFTITNIFLFFQERTKNAQFVIISLRSQMFELADRLVGIYKTYNCTKSVTINPNKLSTNVSASGTRNISQNVSDSPNESLNTTKSVLVESK